MLKLVKQIRLLFPEKTIWLYTGYTAQIETDVIEKDDFWNDEDDEFSYYMSFLPKSNNSHDFLRSIIAANVDVIVDGRFEEDKKDLSLRFRGSSNQRLIDCKKSLEKGEIVLWSN